MLEELSGRMSGGVVWFTGISGAGKSTLSQIVGAELRRLKIKTEILDGDVIRMNLSKGLGFSREDRVTNIYRIAFLAQLLARNDVWVLVAAISPYREIRQEIRKRFLSERIVFVEAYVRCSLEVAESRDPKGLYRRARAGEIAHFTGISDPYEEPYTPDLDIDTEKEAPEESAGRVMTFLKWNELL